MVWAIEEGLEAGHDGALKSTSRRLTRSKNDSTTYRDATCRIVFLQHSKSRLVVHDDERCLLWFDESPLNRGR